MHCSGNESECDSLRSGVVIFAHLCRVKASSPMLASLCKGYDKLNHVPITGVDPEIFQDLLRYLYGGKIPISQSPNSDVGHKHTLMLLIGLPLLT